MKSRNIFYLFPLLLLIVKPLSAGIEWNGAAGDNLWNNPTNWVGNAVPGQADLVLIKSQYGSGENCPHITREINAYAYGVYIGYNKLGSTSELKILGGSITAANNGLSIGFVADGKVTVESGSIDSQGGLILGRGNEWGYGTGTVEINGGLVQSGKITFGTYTPAYQGGTGIIYLNAGTLETENIVNLETPGSFIDIQNGELIIKGDWQSIAQSWIENGYLKAFSGLGRINVEYDTTLPGKTVITATDTARHCKQSKWWESFPRIVSTNNVQRAVDYNASVCITSGQQDPGWGLYGQKVTENPALTAAFEAQDIKSIGYYETFGQAYCLIAELSTPSKSSEYRTIESQHWSWPSYSGGLIKWIGLHNYFDNEYFAEPWTYTHPLYGAEQMRYPDGSIASGYTVSSSDPRSSRVYDAGFVKDVMGNLHITYVYNETVNADDGTDSPTGPIDGLIYVPEDDKYAGLLQFAKDPLCPYFDRFQYSSVNYAAGNGMRGMWTDNYGPWDSLNSTPLKRSFGDWSIYMFNRFLSQNFTQTELSNLGITDIDTFNIAQYLRNKAAGMGADPSNFNAAAWNDGSWQNDKIWQAFLIFKRQSGTEKLKQYYQTTKRAAADAGNDEFAILGNDIPGFSLGWARGDLDMVSTEMSAGWKLCTGSRGFMLPPIGRIAPAYKAAREHAKSRFVNVWFYNDHYEDYLKHSPPQYYENPAVIWVLYSEMLATHTLPKISDGNPRNTGSAATNSEFFDFVSQVEPLFGKRTPVEEIGVYYSSSSILNQLLPGGIKDFENQPHQFAVWGWSTALGQLHFQYRILPEWKLNQDNLAGLKLLIIPEAVVFDPAQTQLLSDWVKQGGRLIVTGSSGERYAEDGFFDTNPNGFSLQGLTNVSTLNDAPDQSLIISGSGKILYVKANAGLDYFANENSRSTLLGDMAGFLSDALSGCELSIQNADSVSSNVSLTVYEDICAGKYFIDAVNFDIDLAADSMNPTPQIKFDLAIPQWMRNKSLMIDTVSPGNAPSASFYEKSSGILEVTLGSFEHYTSIIIETSLQPDISDDGSVNITDLAYFAEHWNSISGSCDALNNWCSGSDIDKNNSVKINDLMIMADNWLLDQ